jgi:TolB-like protein/Flp pilus assembly protein TadD
VLPFVNMSPDKDQEYFADGLSEELIDHLAHAADLKVIARTSSFQFKGKNEDLRAVAGKLGVAHLLEGSVRKSGKILRITAQLIRASDGSHLWSQTYERELRDVFRVQDEIAETVTRALNVAMGPNAKPGRASTSTAEAYNLVMQGNFFKWRQNRQDMERAVGLYREAIRLDPDYALPWARLGAAYFNQATRLWIPRDDGLAKAHKALQRAIELDPDLIWAHYTLGGMYFYAWDWSAVRVEDDRVRAIDPQNFLVLSAESDLASTFGPIQEAVDIELRIVNRDPLAAYALGDLADRQRAAGHLQESLTTSQRLLAMTPQYAGAQSSMGLTRLLLGDYAQALVDVQKEPEEGDRLAALPLIYWAMGRRREADAALLELIEKRATIAPYDIASVYAYRHEVETAFEWLDRAYVQRDAGMTGIKFDPFVSNLRNDPRYKAMLKKMNLPE